MDAWPKFDLDAAEKDLGEDDLRDFNQLTTVSLSPEEILAARTPGLTAPEAKEFLAVHWHPEWVGLDLVAERLRASFPGADHYLAIPTQHNKVMVFGDYAGVEADAWAGDYERKVQLLIHFRADRLPRAGVFLEMMNRTYNYRGSQLMAFLERLISPGRLTVKNFREVRPEAVDLARMYAAKLRRLIIDENLVGSDRDEMLKNRLLPDFIGRRCREGVPRELVEQALIFAETVKKEVKAGLRPEHFHTPEAIVEEARGLGAGVVAPHPPQFWPLLLSGLEVDGWEVWNPSTPRHTVFLVEALRRRNEGRRKKLLAFMGDDTHMSAKIRRNYGPNQEAPLREIGFQPPWFEEAAARALAAAGQSRTRTLNEYRARLA